MHSHLYFSKIFFISHTPIHAKIHSTDLQQTKKSPTRGSKINVTAKNPHHYCNDECKVQSYGYLWCN